MTQDPQPIASAEFANVDQKERLKTLRDLLKRDLVERDDAVKLALLAALAGEHLLLIGPPGTAKSLVARRLRLAFADDRYFERLLTRFTVPEELFGPLSIQALEQDRYERQTKGYLPTSSIAFLDEIFKANSAILNALLTLLNEREFDNGMERQKTPLVAVIGASNELPEGEELDALYDRFLLRLHVGPVGEEGFMQLLNLRGEPSPEIDLGLRLTAEDLLAVRQASQAVVLAPEVTKLLVELRAFCQAEGIPVSDRRWRKIVKLLQTSAVTNGRNEASIWDCWLLQHCLWNQPEQRQKVYAWYAERVGASRVMDPSALVRVVALFERQLQRDKTNQSQCRDQRGRLLYLDDDGARTTRTGGMRRGKRNNAELFLAPDKATTDNPAYSHLRPVDRQNHGEGYTREELADLYVSSHQKFENWGGKSKYLDDKANHFIVHGEYTPVVEPQRHKQAYVDHQIGELNRHHTTLGAYLADHQRITHELVATVSGHLWLDPAFLEPASVHLRNSGQVATDLQRRLGALVDGFTQLPTESDVEFRERDSLSDFDADLDDFDLDDMDLLGNEDGLDLDEDEDHGVSCNQ